MAGGTTIISNLTADPDTEPLLPVTPHRAMCNRLVLEEAARTYDRRHGRDARRQAVRDREAQPPEQEVSAAA